MVHFVLRALTSVLLITTVLGCRTARAPATQPTAVAAIERADRRPLTGEQRRLNVESFDQVWTTVRDKHFDPNLNGVDWNAAREELRPRVEAATTMADARDVMEELLGRLGQTHFGILPASVYRQLDQPTGDQSPASTQPAGDDNVSPDEREKGTPGLDIRIVDGKPLVTRVDPDGSAARAGVRPGWLLTEIRGKAVAPVLAAIGESVHSESLRPAMQARALESALHAPLGSTVPTTFTDGRGRQRKVQLPVQRESGQVAKFGNLPPIYVRHLCGRVEPNIACFYLSIFLDPVNVMPALRSCVSEAAASSADGFILDLRGNPGGIGYMAVGMGNLFVDEPNQRLGEMTGRTGSAGDGALRFVLDPQVIHFDGPLAILVDECSMSTSEILAGGLRDIGRARVFGVRTAGAALPSVVERLPNGDRFQYVVANYTSAGGQTLEGHGVEPDEVVVPDRESLLAGRDPILDAAVRWITSQKASPQGGATK